MTFYTAQIQKQAEQLLSEEKLKLISKHRFSAKYQV